MNDDIEIIVPYGNPNGALHLRFKDDHATFCGRNCKHWSATDTTLKQAIDSVYTCKRCLKAAFK